MKYKILNMVFAALCALCVACAPCGAAGLSKKVSTAIIVKGPTHAVEVLRRELINKGFRIVSMKQIEAIKRHKAAIYALEGNVEAIKNLSRQYGVGQIIRGTLTVQNGVRNAVGFMAAAEMSVHVHGANGVSLYADSCLEKGLGYTPKEAESKALAAAAQRIAWNMTGGQPVGTFGGPAGSVTVVFKGASYAEAQRVVRYVENQTDGVTSSAVKGHSGSSTTVVFKGSFDHGELIDVLSDRCDGEVRQSGGKIVVDYD